jgi:transcriptional regulator with AAA-type ATPase domain
VNPAHNVASIQSANSASGTAKDDPLSIIALQLRRLFSEYGDGAHFEALESLIVHQAFSYVRSNQVHGAALLGISRNVMRTLLKRHGLLSDSGFGRNDDDNQIDLNELQAG